MVKLIGISDVSSVLSKRSNLCRPLIIKPDLTQEERLCESTLMKERWRLIQSGVARGDIKVRGPRLYVRGKVHCHYTNSAFQSVSTQQEHMSRRRRQGASNYVERHLHLRAFSAFRIRTVLEYGEYPLW